MKRDVLPGQYETLWFRADRTGTYHLFCAQFCGTDHASMIGSVVVMTGADYASTGWRERRRAARWRSRAGACSSSYGCSGCHRGGTALCARHRWTACTAARCRCRTARTVIADDRYIRDSILYPEPAGGRELSRRSCRPSPA